MQYIVCVILERRRTSVPKNETAANKKEDAKKKKTSKKKMPREEVDEEEYMERAERSDKERGEDLVDASDADVDDDENIPEMPTSATLPAQKPRRLRQGLWDALVAGTATTLHSSDEYARNPSLLIGIHAIAEYLIYLLYSPLFPFVSDSVTCCVLSGTSCAGRRVAVLYDQKAFGNRFYLGTISSVENNNKWAEVIFDEGDSKITYAVDSCIKALILTI